MTSRIKIDSVTRLEGTARSIPPDDNGNVANSIFGFQNYAVLNDSLLDAQLRKYC